MNKKLIVALTMLLAFAVVGSVAFADSYEEEQTVETEAQVQEKSTDLTGAMKYLAAALAVGVACIGGAMAVGKIGAAAMGAMSENAELSGKALPFVGLAEGICLWGFLVALFIIIMQENILEYFVIGEREIVLGFMLSGVKGQAVSNRSEALEAFNRVTGKALSSLNSEALKERPEVLILTEDVSDMLSEEVLEWQMKGEAPLLVEIPGLQGHIPGRKSLTDSIREAVGIQV